MQDIGESQSGTSSHASSVGIMDYLEPSQTNTNPKEPAGDKI